MISEKLKQLKEQGQYNDLVKLGVIPLKVNYYFEMNELFNIRMIVNQGLSYCRMQSIEDVAEQFKVHENTVRNAIKFMDQSLN